MDSVNETAVDSPGLPLSCGKPESSPDAPFLVVDAAKISAAIDGLTKSVLRMSQRHNNYNHSLLWDTVDAGRAELRKLESAQSAARQL
jgi:hypothetical protein